MPLLFTLPPKVGKHDAAQDGISVVQPAEGALTVPEQSGWASRCWLRLLSGAVHHRSSEARMLARSVDVLDVPIYH